eukprot:TRINITY_DN330_c0_g1_i16.p8 TRINITY_DN330_c0_g1~~TRINITY_DN330_c0_g1_i16.p8  ORF type:complete len:109 (-),score=8.91 TRINITY_DN330_c0_g1_i16:497-823(-)
MQVAQKSNNLYRVLFQRWGCQVRFKDPRGRTVRWANAGPEEEDVDRALRRLSSLESKEGYREQWKRKERFEYPTNYRLIDVNKRRVRRIEERRRDILRWVIKRAERGY